MVRTYARSVDATQYRGQGHCACTKLVELLVGQVIQHLLEQLHVQCAHMGRMSSSSGTLRAVCVTRLACVGGAKGHLSGDWMLPATQVSETLVSNKAAWTYQEGLSNAGAQEG
jgi:hypothetical protein